MPRKNLIRSKEFPYHVTARTNNKVLFPVALNFVWKIATDELYLLHLLYDIEVHAFVLMPNHIHLLITGPEEDLGIVMNLLMSTLTRKINILCNHSGHVFGGPYFRSLIPSARYFGHVLKYVYRNPVKANLCERVEEYEFSTLKGLSGSAHLPFPVYFTRMGLELNLPEPENQAAWLDWLNRPFPAEAEKIIRKLLRKREIKEILNRVTRRPCEELNQRL
jgi:putative transposase